jgi:hypothetical protein
MKGGAHYQELGKLAFFGQLAIKRSE